MASLWRNGHCAITIRSLSLQAELRSLTVVCNNYTDEQFNWLESQVGADKITLVRGFNSKKSNEKLRYIATGSGHFLAFADDDIAYPADYLHYMINGALRYNSCVSLHGSRLAPHPINNYYTDRYVYRCLEDVVEDVAVDVVGNGTALIQRHQLPKIELESLYIEADTVSMDDIYFSALVNKYGIRRYVLRHNKGYLSHKPLEDNDNYVFNFYQERNFKCPIQSNFININLTNRCFN